MSMETDIRAKKNEKRVGVLENSLAELDERMKALTGPQEVPTVDTFTKEELQPVLMEMAKKMKQEREALLRMCDSFDRMESYLVKAGILKRDQKGRTRLSESAIGGKEYHKKRKAKKASKKTAA